MTKLGLAILFLLYKKLEILGRESTDLKGSKSNIEISLTWLGLGGREIEGLEVEIQIT